MSFVTDRGPGFKHFTATFLFPSPWLCGLYLWREINPQHHRFVTALSNVHASIFHLIILYLPPYPPRAILLLKLSKCGPNLDFPIYSCFSCCHTWHKIRYVFDSFQSVCSLKCYVACYLTFMSLEMSAQLSLKERNWQIKSKVFLDNLKLWKKSASVEPITSQSYHSLYKSRQTIWQKSFLLASFIFLWSCGNTVSSHCWITLKSINRQF